MITDYGIMLWWRQRAICLYCALLNDNCIHALNVSCVLFLCQAMTILNFKKILKLKFFGKRNKDSLAVSYNAETNTQIHSQDCKKKGMPCISQLKQL